MKTPIFEEQPLVPILSHCGVARKNIDDIPDMIHDSMTDTNPSNMFMRMFYIASALNQNELAEDMQEKALQHSCIYRINNPAHSKIRLLALMGVGNMTDNVPIDFIIENSDIRLDLLYVLPEKEMPLSIPDHDIAFVALG
ncbi:MAG: hypothetical protein PHC99_06420, partial [Methylococcales bacterium]|nr:hypothetical protein [Methylococcales bacterium]